MGVATGAGRGFEGFPSGDGVMKRKEGLGRGAVKDGFGEVKLGTKACR